MNLQHLYYFQKLSELQHYSQTATALNVSQSNLSYAISSLEKELGAQLFEKKGRNVQLTGDGELFLEYVNRALSELETGRDVVQTISAQNRSAVRLAAFRIQAAYELVEGFRNKNEDSNIRFFVHHKKSIAILRDLKNKKIDVGICSYRKTDTALEFMPIIRQHLVALMHAEHPLADKTELDLREIARYPVVIPNGSSDGMYRQIIGLFDAIGEKPLQYSDADFVSAAAFLASKNFGIALVINNPVLKNFNVRIIPVTNPKADFHLYLTYAKDLWHSQAVRVFLDYAKSCAHTMSV
ncbi:LysR family transcriptional regulator [Synergistaceae bacterium OttesenSCG-928-I11]|nr:LysR family transcriptional regulator [Synergistaceae bacterium OttesenSCG-928-I11]